MKLFQLDEESKAALQEISSTFGIPMSDVQQTWEYTVFTMMLKIAQTAEEKPEDPVIVTIPFIGKVFIRDKGITFEDGSPKPNLDLFFVGSDSFKELVHLIKNDQFLPLSHYVDDQYITRVSESIEATKLISAKKNKKKKNMVEKQKLDNQNLSE